MPAETKYFECPFCKEPDFDLIGLKNHFEKGYCDVYNETDLLIIPSSSGQELRSKFLHAPNK
jgi:hypothetical protein